MSDRRRINGPAGETSPAVFNIGREGPKRPQRLRQSNELRRMFLKTGFVPAANGSAYLELEAPTTHVSTFLPTSSTIKLSCSVHGPKPLARNASFSPNLQLSASIKFAPFSTMQRRGYVRDNIERDLGSHLENALKGVIIPDRWPKSSIDVAVTVLEGEGDYPFAQEQEQELSVDGIGLMNVLGGSITVATAALVDAGVDCLDLLTGGVAAISTHKDTTAAEILDPCPAEHDEFRSACVVAYLPSRDEIVEIWCKGNMSTSSTDIGSFEKLVNAAIRSARGSHNILADALKESALARAERQVAQDNGTVKPNISTDIEMET